MLVLVQATKRQSRRLQNGASLALFVDFMFEFRRCKPAVCIKVHKARFSWQRGRPRVLFPSRKGAEKRVCFCHLPPCLCSSPPPLVCLQLVQPASDYLCGCVLFASLFLCQLVVVLVTDAPVFLRVSLTGR